MGLFKKRQDPPMPIGQAFCVVDGHARAFVSQQHHAKMTPDAIGALAPVTWAISVAIDAETRGRQAVTEWLAAITEFPRPNLLNATVNMGGIHQLDTAGSPPDGAAAVGSFVILPSNHLSGQWQRAAGFTDAAHALRVHGALWQAADWLGQGREVQFALETLASTDVDFTNPGVPLTLPQMLLDHGAQMAAMHSMMDTGPDDAVVGESESLEANAEPRAIDENDWESDDWELDDSGYGEREDAEPDGDDRDGAGPPPGWYEAPDGSGQRQWWTGSVWGPTA